MTIHYKSSKMQRNIQRFNAGGEVLQTSLQAINVAASIPTKVSQCVASVFSIFNDDTKKCERIMNGAQAAIGFGQVALLIALAYQSDDCEDKSLLCTSYFVIEWIYKGLLLATWTVSEASKETQEDSIIRQSNNVESLSP